MESVAAVDVKGEGARPAGFDVETVSGVKPFDTVVAKYPVAGQIEARLAPRAEGCEAQQEERKREPDTPCGRISVPARST